MLYTVLSLYSPRLRTVQLCITSSREYGGRSMVQRVCVCAHDLPALLLHWAQLMLQVLN